MNSLFRKVMMAFLVFATVASLIVGIGCGDNAGGDGGKVTITIGALLDLSGPASVGIKPIAEGYLDLVKWYNDHEVIPGVTINGLVYDTQYSVARVLPGYDWLRSQGAQAIYAVVPEDAAALQTRVKQDRVPQLTGILTPEIMADPGYTFVANGSYEYNSFTGMKWIAENQWDYKTKGPAKIGFVGWQLSSNVIKVNAMQAYAQAHPDQWTYVVTSWTPFGGTFEGVVDQFRDCDYICSTSNLYAGFWKAYLAAGYSKAIAVDFEGNLGTYLDYVVAMNGWQPYDNAVQTLSCPTWSELDKYPLLQTIRNMIETYRTNGADYTTYADRFGYMAGSYSISSTFLDILALAVKMVGAENFNSEAYYNACLEYKTDGPIWANHPVWSFDEYHCLGHGLDIVLINAAEKRMYEKEAWVPMVTAP